MNAHASIVHDILQSILINNTPVNIVSFVTACKFPSNKATEIISSLQTHTLLKRTQRGAYKHVWWRALAKLCAAAAGTLIDPLEWSLQHNIPDSRAFCLYAHSSSTLHFFSNGCVRVATVHNLVDKQGISKVIKAQGTAGVLRSSILREYDNAYDDLQELINACIVYCVGNNVWHCSVFAAYPQLKPFCAVVMQCVATGLNSIRLIGKRMQCADIDIEFAVEILVKQKCVQVVLPGHGFVRLASTSPYTFEADSQTSSRPRRLSKKLKMRRKQCSRLL